MARLEAEGVPCAPVLTRGEMIRHASDRGQRHRGRDRASAGRPAASGAQCGAFQRNDAGASRRRSALGEHTAEILSEAGFTAEECESLRLTALGDRS